ncbi:hypothetical protein HanIR_Chr09g0394141 [Helianthus annuus]|nr:hypothetical protein HanIR_Chr09g0394141 [Helianthus annuus]
MVFPDTVYILLHKPKESFPKHHHRHHPGTTTTLSSNHRSFESGLLSGTHISTSSSMSSQKKKFVDQLTKPSQNLVVAGSPTIG